MKVLKEENGIYLCRTSGPNPIEYYLSFNKEPLDFSRPAKLFSMMAKDLAQNNFTKRRVTANMQGNLS
ncbi:MAG: hypothetical protein OSJ27_08705 [Candidatus Gastranaerophilales bacterium]|nr:hypothetical protein [Candidatus Gastranaerophilales bacterium]